MDGGGDDKQLSTFSSSEETSSSLTTPTANAPCCKRRIAFSAFTPSRAASRASLRSLYSRLASSFPCGQVLGMQPTLPQQRHLNWGTAVPAAPAAPAAPPRPPRPAVRPPRPRPRVDLSGGLGGKASSLRRRASTSPGCTAGAAVLLGLAGGTDGSCLLSSAMRSWSPKASI